MADVLREVLKLAIEYDVTSSLVFYEEDGDIQVGVNCSDCFWWGTADAETVTESNLSLYKQTLEDCKALPEAPMEYPINRADELFAARVRQMRPQGACYKTYPPCMWPLFNACGPERETGLGNPHKLPTLEEYLKK